MKNANQAWSSASYWNQTYVNCWEVCSATTKSTMLSNSHMEEGEHQGGIFFCNRCHCINSINVGPSASYGNRTHVHSLEGYYATTTPTMLVNTVPDGRKDYELKRFLSELYWNVSDPVTSSVSYGTLTHVKRFESYYATTTPTLFVCSDLDSRNPYGFKIFWSKIFAKIKIG